MEKHFKNFFFKIAAIFLVFSIIGNFAFAQDNATPDSNTKPTTGQFEVSKYLKIEDGQSYLEEKDPFLEEGEGKYGITYFIIRAIEILTTIIGTFALLFVIVGGIILMVSSGNEQMQTKGKDIVKYALIGVVIAFTSLLIVTFVQSIFFTV